MKKEERVKEVIEELEKTGEFDIFMSEEKGKKTYLILDKRSKRKRERKLFKVMGH